MTDRHRAVPTRAEVEAGVSAVTAGEPGLVAAFLFGSVARGTSGPLSDVDVAVLVADRDRRIEVVDRVTDALTRRLRSLRVDVVDLDVAPAPLRYRILRDGRRLFCRDPGRLQRLAAVTVREYLDFQPLRDRAFRLMRAAILESR